MTNKGCIKHLGGLGRLVHCRDRAQDTGSQVVQRPALFAFQYCRYSSYHAVGALALTRENMNNANDKITSLVVHRTM